MDLDNGIVDEETPSAVNGDSENASVIADYSDKQPPVPLRQSTPIETSKSELNDDADESTVKNDTLSSAHEKSYFNKLEKIENGLEEELFGLDDFDPVSDQVPTQVPIPDESGGVLCADIEMSENLETGVENNKNETPEAEAIPEAVPEAVPEAAPEAAPEATPEAAVESDATSTSKPRYWFRERKPKIDKIGNATPKLTRVKKNKKCEKKKKDEKKARPVEPATTAPIDIPFEQPATNNINFDDDPDESNENLIRIII